MDEALLLASFVAALVPDDAWKGAWISIVAVE